MYGKAVLAGNLSFVSLADLFQILGGNNCTGVLHIASQYAPNPGLIYFGNGNPINATSGPLHGIDAIYALFGWSEGNFEFHQQNVQVERVVNKSRMEIILDALMMLDDGVIKKVGPPSPEDMCAVQSGESKYVKTYPLPVIKGPLVDYRYVIDEEEFRDGEKIVREGGHGNWVWVILEGTVKITRETSKGPMTIAKLGDGCFIGTFASFLLRGHVRSATATAVGNVQLGVLDTQRLAGECASLSLDFRGLLLSLDARLTRITDRAGDLFMKKNKVNTLNRGKKVIIIKEGPSKQELFTITDGEAYVIRRTPRGYLPLLTLKEGDVFGYVPFIDIGHEPRCASVLASKHLKVNKLDTENLQKEYDQLSTAFKGLIENVATCVSVTTRLADYLQEEK